MSRTGKTRSELQEFVSDGTFDSSKYFYTFMDCFYNVVRSGELELPEGLSLSTEFEPCEVCKNTDYLRVQHVRCRHQKDCQDHKQYPKHDDDEKCKCNCSSFTAPCITFSKIGLVLHLEFRQKDGTFLRLDIDINPPSISLPKKLLDDFDGSPTKKRAWLVKERKNLVGWKTEFEKSEDNSEAAGWNDGLKRSIRLRFFNLYDVIAEQVRPDIAIT